MVSGFVGNSESTNSDKTMIESSPADEAVVIAENIRRLRHLRGLKQKDMSKYGFSLRYFQKVESGETNFTVRSLQKLAKVFGVRVVDLFAEGTCNEEHYRRLFLESPFGVILWRLVDLMDPYSLVLHDFNECGEKAVYRNLESFRGKNMFEVFPLAEEQGLIDIFFKVINSGESQFIPQLIRHDKDFPLTVFSAKFIKAGSQIGAAIFTDVTDEYLAKEQVQRQKRDLQAFRSLPPGSPVDL